MKNLELLNRLIISEDDFYQAKSFIRYVLEKDLRYEDNDDEIRLVLKAFNTAIIVSYCRPFTRNHISENHPASYLPAEYLELLTEDEKKLHIRILSVRNTEQAHSDADARSVFLPANSIFSIRRDATIPLGYYEFVSLEKIIDKYLIEITKQKNDISSNNFESRIN